MHELATWTPDGDKGNGQGGPNLAAFYVVGIERPEAVRAEPKVVSPEPMLADSPPSDF